MRRNRKSEATGISSRPNRALLLLCLTLLSGLTFGVRLPTLEARAQTGAPVPSASLSRADLIRQVQEAAHRHARMGRDREDDTVKPLLGRRADLSEPDLRSAYEEAFIAQKDAIGSVVSPALSE